MLPAESVPITIDSSPQNKSRRSFLHKLLGVSTVAAGLLVSPLPSRAARWSPRWPRDILQYEITPALATAKSDKFQNHLALWSVQGWSAHGRDETTYGLNWIVFGEPAAIEEHVDAVLFAHPMPGCELDVKKLKAGPLVDGLPSWAVQLHWRVVSLEV